MTSFLERGNLTACGLREGDVRIIMERRVAVWAAQQAQKRLLRELHTPRVRRGPIRKQAA